MRSPIITIQSLSKRRGIVSLGLRRVMPGRLAHLRGANQPVSYVSWDDAFSYCQNGKGSDCLLKLNGKKLCGEPMAERGPGEKKLRAIQLILVETKMVLNLPHRLVPFPKIEVCMGYIDGAGNLMEWVDNWYVEDLYKPTRIEDAKVMTQKGGGVPIKP